MKIAIVHDYIKEYGGAEKVLESLHDVFPQAPIFTTVYLPEFLGPHKKNFEKFDIRPSFLQKFPFKAKLISPIRLISKYVFGSMNFGEYDVVIVSATGAYFPNFIKKAGAKHVVYCHTPPRYLYGYTTARNYKKNSINKWLINKLTKQDYESNQNPDFFIANSYEVAGRIKRFYNREAVVVNPPVDIPDVKLLPLSDRNYYVAGGRLARAKKIDLAILAANKLNINLKIFGKGFAGSEEELKKLAGPTVEFLGEVSDAQKFELLGGAKALINPSVDEDFGILNVESMGVGTPVVAHNSGGTKETVIDGKTGILFDEANLDSLIKAINKLEKIKIDPKDCINQAKNFSKSRFEKEIKEYIYAGTS
jgi:glycosyltransferase involved in cell wall biosynthesis